MVIYSEDMPKEAKQPRQRILSKRQQALVLPVMIIIGAAVVVLAIVSIVATPAADKLKRGVAANGFTAFPEEGTDLGVGKVVSRDDVVSALGDKAKSVSNANVSGVFNYDGDRGQTLTFNFTRNDGKQASLYIDVMKFKSSDAMNDAHIYTLTGKTKAINGHPTYYMVADTQGSSREYRVMVVNGLKAYKFVIDQPVNNVTISEVSADAALIKLAQKAHL